MKRATLLLLVASACAHSPAQRTASTPAQSQATRAAPSRPPKPAKVGDLSGPAFPQAEPAPAADPFAETRARVDALLRDQAAALWGAWTRGERADLSKTYGGREDLFTVDSVRKIGEAERRASGDDRRALHLLYGFLAGEHLSRETRDAADRLARARAGAKVSWGGEAVPFDAVPGLLAAEPDAGRRATLLRLQSEALAAWAPQATAQATQLDAAARRLGEPSAVDLGAALRGSTRDELAAFAEKVLNDTYAAYQQAMDALARAELGHPLAEVRGGDLPRLFRSVQDPRMFPASRLLPDVRSVFAGLHLDLESRPGAVLDLDARPRKDPRPIALPVSVPDDVRLSAVPGGGIGDVRALLHEMALASFFSRIESPRMEFRRLGNTTGETWALLFEDLAGDPQWLVERTGDTEYHVAPLVRAAAAQRLHAAREAAFRLLLELRRPASPADATRVATALLERAMARPVSPEEVALALADRDPLLQSAVALRAAVLSAQAERFFVAGAGAQWWKDARVGAFLGRAFAAGSRPDAPELSAAFGSSAMDPSALAVRSRDRMHWVEAH